MKAIFRILGTAAAVAATGADIVIMDKLLNEKAAPIIESIEFPEEAEKDDAEAAKTAEAYAEGEAKAEAEAAAPAGGRGGAADEELFSMLKDLRKKVAKQHGLPPFVIFQDPSLEDMAVQYPITFEEMQNITGVGVGKARKFGEEFMRLI